MNKDQLITVCTATYNRGSLLPVLYASLVAQTDLTFEWVVIDDGSTDDTEYQIEQWKKEAPFEIIYQKQTNQGKHIAINTGVQLAKGHSVFIVDSDDRLPQESIKIIQTRFQTIKDNDAIAGLIGLKCFFNRKVVGSTHLKDEVICDIFDYRYKHKVQGDRAEVFKTDVLKKYPFPKYKNEKFVPESIVWNRIGQEYKMLFFNENVYECEYLEDGLSAQSVSLRRTNPQGIIHLYAELARVEKIGFQNRIKTYINFWRFYFCDLSDAKENLKLLKGRLLSFLCLPVGALFYLKDSLILKSKG